MHPPKRMWNVRISMIISKRYKFTKKRTPKKSVMAVVLGLIACFSEVLTIYLSYTLGGDIPAQYGLVILLSLLFAITGLVLSIWSVTYKEIYRLFPILGIVINAIGIFIVGFIIYVAV